jgi:hypothetical protein
MTEKEHICVKKCRFGGSKMTLQHIGNLKMTLASIYDRKRPYLRKKCRFDGSKKTDRKSEIDVFFEKLRSESPQMLKSQKLHASVYLRSNTPQTELVAALDIYNFINF